MKALLRIIDAVDDRLNPVVVKELRQAVQSRFVVVMLLGFLLVDVLVVLWGAVSQDYRNQADTGRDVFLFLHAILLLACLGFLPLYAAARLGAEHGDGNTDLLFITTIRPGAVVRGKFAAAMALAMVVFGACTPFMTFTYLLRGIDLPTIFFILVISLAATAEAVMFALLLAAMPVGRVFRTFLALVLIGALVIGYGLTMSASGVMAFTGVSGMMDEPDFWGIFGVWTVIALGGLGLMYVMAVALLSPRSSNRTQAVRSYLTVVWAGGFALAVCWSVLSGGSSNDPIIAWTVASLTFLSLSVFVAVSEREELGPRIRRAIPRSGLLRVLVFPFFTGAFGGVVWCVLLGAGTVILAWSSAAFTGPGPTRGDLENACTALGCMALMSYAYAMTGALLRRVLFPKARCEFNGLAGMIAVAVGCLLPWVLGFFLGVRRHGDTGNEAFWLLTNPFAAIVLPGEATVPLVFAMVWSVVITLANIPWLVRQAEGFVPLAAPPAAAPAVQEAADDHG